jgi:hypothetical protein
MLTAVWSSCSVHYCVTTAVAAVQVLAHYLLSVQRRSMSLQLCTIYTLLSTSMSDQSTVYQ